LQTIEEKSALVEKLEASIRAPRRLSAFELAHPHSSKLINPFKSLRNIFPESMAKHNLM
jgi:hypothetical protein